ncbi:LPS-assembly protein LptD [Marinobacterium rhizophilum]|uniref:LPS-assembly protein LptD n=1 Tax=Marinobacterium rhizophilum TaxID=420402 RepID=UPI000A076D8D|nr:LPS assembly protein LptD [Marinobacterium rhizophilum]
MPFLRRSAYKLSLAISSALFAQIAAAQTSDTLGWDCTQTSQGQWECGAGSVDAATPAPTATAPTTAPSVQATGSARPATAAPPAATTGEMPPQPVVPKAPAFEPSADESAAPAIAPAATAATQTAAPQTADAAIITTAPLLTDNPYAHLDWYPYAPGEQTGLCRGRYIEPAMEVADGDTPFNLQRVLIAAASSQSELGGLTQLEGGVQVTQGGRQLSSAYAEYDQLTQLVRLEGDVSYRERGLLLVSDAAQTNLNNLETIFSQSEYVLHPQHVRGDAERILRLEDGRIRIEDGSYTQCEPGNTSWQLAADSIVLNPNTGFGEARGAVLEVLDVPVLYMPYFYFPIDDRRVSGFLYPSINYSSSEGIDIAAPYYFNLAPNYDDTFTPRILSERGLILENEFRYMNRWSQTALSNGILVDDDKTGEDRWLLGVDHEGTPWAGWQSYIDYTAVSDVDYFDDLDPTNLDVSYASHLNKLGELRYNTQNWSFIARTHGYQSLTTSEKSPYRRLPQFLFDGRVPDLGGGLEADYQAEYVRFDRDSSDPLLSLEDKVQGDRVHLSPGVSLPMEHSWGYLTPALKLWTTQYQLDDQVAGRDENPSVNTLIASVDSGLTFERRANFKDRSYTQTLEPRLFYLYVPEEDQDDIPAFDTAELDFRYDSLFRTNRFSGRDRIGDANQLSLGLASKFYDDTGRERFGVALGQAYYFEDRTVQLETGNPPDTESTSNFAAKVDWSLTPDLRISHDSELDKNDLGAVAQNYRLTYSPKGDRLVYASYRDHEAERQQADIGLRWPINPQWNILARWREDLMASETLDALLGVEYKDCCWKVRLGVREWTRDDDGVRTTDQAVMLQFVLRGLGSVGDDNTTKFLRDITGFDEDKDEEF